MEIDSWISESCVRRRLVGESIEQPTSRLIDVNIASDRAAEDLKQYQPQQAKPRGLITYELLAVRAMTRFVLYSLGELWILYTFDLFLAHALRRMREELSTFVIILALKRLCSCSRAAVALSRFVITLEE